MSTRSTSSNLFSPLRDPESLIRRRNLGEPSSLFDFEEVMSIPHNNQGPPPAGPPPPNNNGPPPVATDFGLRHHMIQQVQNTCQFHGLPGDDANRHIDKFLEVTQHMKQNGVSDDALHTIQSTRREELYATDTEESYDRSRTYRSHNHWDTSATRDETSRTISSTTTTESPEVVRQLEMMNKNFLDMMRQIQSVKSVSPKCETCGGPHSFTECLAIDGYTQEAVYATTGSGSLPSNTIANPRGDVKAITTRSGVAYNGPMIPPIHSSLPKEVERETEATKDKVQNTNLGSTTHVQPPVVQVPILEPEVALKPNPKPSIPYLSRLIDQKLCKKANYHILKFFQIQSLSFADSLLHYLSSLLTF
ncbi:hypothetical protein Tco_0246943 [Tanacetum coccineum]